MITCIRCVLVMLPMCVVSACRVNRYTMPPLLFSGFFPEGVNGVINKACS